MKRDTRTAFRARAAKVEREISDALAEAKVVEDAARKAGKELAFAAEAARVKFTAADLSGAVAVRDRFGWHRVVRVNRATVTVETGYSWTRAVPVAKVLEFREATA